MSKPLTNQEKFARITLPKTINIPKGVILDSAPTKIELYGDWYDLTIAIGPDHTARLFIDADAIRELHKLEPEVKIT